MKKALRGLRGVAAAAGVAVLVQGLGTLALGPAADAGNGDVTATTRVHVRTGPSTSYKSLTVINKGTTLPSSGSSNGWTKVTYNGKTAWIASAYLQGSKSSAPSSETSNGTTAGQGGTTYTTANLNLRTGPSLRDKVYVVIKKGASLSLTGKVSGGYAQISYKGKTLWASTSHLSSTKGSTSSSLPKVTSKARGTTALMIRTSSSSKFTNLGDAPKGTIFDLTGVKENGMAQVIYKGAVRWVNAKYLTAVSGSTTPSPPDAPKTSTRYATTVLNIWAAATGQSYSGEIPRGGELQVTGTVKNGRAEIVINGAKKWVTAKYVSTSKPASSGSGASTGGGTSLNRGYSSGLDQTNANVQSIVRDVWNRYPQIKTMYGWRRDVTPDHPAGRAVDVMIPSYKTNSALGWEIAKYYQAHASEYNINYIIFDQKIWSTARTKEGWRSMANRGGDSANHKDHVHINTHG